MRSFLCDTATCYESISPTARNAPSRSSVAGCMLSVASCRLQVVCVASYLCCMLSVASCLCCKLSVLHVEEHVRSLRCTLHACLLHAADCMACPLSVHRASTSAACHEFVALCLQRNAADRSALWTTVVQPLLPANRAALPVDGPPVACALSSHAVALTARDALHTGLHGRPPAGLLLTHAFVLQYFVPGMATATPDPRPLAAFLAA